MRAETDYSYKCLSGSVGKTLPPSVTVRIFVTGSTVAVPPLVKVRPGKSSMPSASIMLPLTVAPANTTSVPPLLTTVPSTVAPADATSVPPLLTTVPVTVAKSSAYWLAPSSRTVPLAMPPPDDDLSAAATDDRGADSPEKLNRFGTAVAHRGAGRHATAGDVIEPSRAHYREAGNAGEHVNDAAAAHHVASSDPTRQDRLDATVAYHVASSDPTGHDRLGATTKDGGTGHAEESLAAAAADRDEPCQSTEGHDFGASIAHHREGIGSTGGHGLKATQSMWRRSRFPRTIWLRSRRR